MLRAALLEFRKGQGDIFEKMMSNRGSACSTYPLRRIASLHTFRLLSCLEQMFDVDSQLYFARKGKSGLECEWTLGCFSGVDLSLGVFRCLRWESEKVNVSAPRKVHSR